MTRRDRILVLLEHYLDVQPGLVDTDGGDGLGGLDASGPWKHHSYRQLEELRVRMRSEEPFLYWHLAETYFRCQTKRVAVCPVCRREAPPRQAGWVGSPGGLCNHGKRHGRSVRMVPGVRRVVSKAVDRAIVERAIDWLAAEWEGSVRIPNDLKAAA